MPDANVPVAAALPPGGDQLAFLTWGEARTAEAAMARIFPDDDLGPGAVEAGTVYYLDRALAGAEGHFQDFYREGLRALDRLSETHFGAPFASCGPGQQDDLLRAMSEDRVPEFSRWSTAAAFFDQLRSHTIEGMFSDPIHGGNRNVAGWRLLGYTGPQPSYSHAEQQIDAPIIRDRIYTAADYPLSEPAATK